MAEIRIRLPMQFRGYVGGALTALATRTTGLGERLMTPEGVLRRFVNLYRGDEDIRRLQGLETPVAQGDVVMILVAMAGG